MTRLHGKTALVTGASKGLGRAMARALAGAGARLILVSRDLASLTEVRNEIIETGGSADALVADVCSEESVRELGRMIRQSTGSIQILINNAGINIRKPVTDFSLDEWRKVLDTNLTGAFLMCREFVPIMRGNGYGRIINMTSIMSHVALPQRTAYAASKSGLLGFTKALALELVHDKITVNGISPGPFATEMNRPIIENAEANAQFISKIPAGMWGNVPDLGELVLYVCSEAAQFMTGTDIVIDGGWTAQ